MNRKPVIIITLILALVIVLGLVFTNAANNRSSSYNEQTPKEAEVAGGKAVAITNIGSLSDILLPSQLRATRTGLNDFLLTYLDPNITGAKITGTPIIQGDGSVFITVTATAPEGKVYSFERTDSNSSITTSVVGSSKPTYSFSVFINRNNPRTLTLSIKEYNYQGVVDL